MGMIPNPFLENYASFSTMDLTACTDATSADDAARFSKVQPGTIVVTLLAQVLDQELYMKVTLTFSSGMRPFLHHTYDCTSVFAVINLWAIVLVVNVNKRSLLAHMRQQSSANHSQLEGHQFGMLAN
eukprot:3865411-Amphidinium_carterae.1